MTGLKSIQDNLASFVNNWFGSQPKEKEVSYLGRTIIKFTNIVGSKPTRSEIVNWPLRVAFAVTLVSPFAFATVGAVFLDALVMVKNGLVNTYNAIRSRFSKKPEPTLFAKIYEVLANNKELIIGASLLGIIVYAEYSFREKAGEGVGYGSRRSENNPGSFEGKAETRAPSIPKSLLDIDFKLASAPRSKCSTENCKRQTQAFAVDNRMFFRAFR